MSIKSRLTPLGLLCLFGMSTGQAAQAPPTAPASRPTAAPPPYVTPDYIRRAPVLPPNRDLSRVLRLTLAEAIETAMRRNLSLNFEREQITQVNYGQSAAVGLFEPTVTAQAEHDDSRTPPQTLQEENAGQILIAKRNFWNVGLAEHIPTGADLRINFSSSFSDSTLGTAVAPKLVRSVFSASLSQPLLRDFSFTGRVQLAPLLSARFATEREREQARLTAMQVVRATEEAYWNLVESIKSYEVTAGALDLAGRQLELTRRQIAAGTTPESDLISAEATHAQRELALVRAEAAIDQTSDILRAFLNLPTEEWDRPLLVVDTPRFLSLQVAVAPALEHAMANRPELKRVQIDLKQVALSLDLARNARLPRLDAQASYNTVGQADTFHSSFDQVTSASGRGWSLGLALSWAPLGTAARAEIHRLESVLRQNGIGREQIIVQVRSEIRQAIRAIETAERQVHAAARSRELSERSLDVEQRRFVSGLSSNFVIAQRQAEVETARQSELDALVQQEKAISDLQLAMGDLLESRKIRFEITGPS